MVVENGAKNYRKNKFLDAPPWGFWNPGRSQNIAYSKGNINHCFWYINATWPRTLIWLWQSVPLPSLSVTFEETNGIGVAQERPITCNRCYCGLWCITERHITQLIYLDAIYGIMLCCDRFVIIAPCCVASFVYFVCDVSELCNFILAELRHGRNGIVSHPMWLKMHVHLVDYFRIRRSW